MNIHDRKFETTERSTSKNPHDWGRAMAVAISRLAAMAREAGDSVPHDSLYGEDLHLYVEEVDDGVDITVSWTPRIPAGTTTTSAAGGPVS